MSLKENIKYIAQTSTSSIFNAIISIVRSKVVAILIGTAGFGIIGQLNSLINIAGFLSAMGMEQGLINEVGVAKKKNNQEAINHLCGTFFIVITWMSLILASMVFLFANRISVFLFDSQDYIGLVRLTTPFICTLGLNIGYNTFLAANKRIKALVLKSMASSFLTSLSTVLFVYFYKIDGIVYGLILNGFINAGLGVYFVKKNQLKSFTRNITSLNLHGKSLKILLKYGSVIMYSSLMYQIVNLGIKNIIIENTTIDDVGIFQAAINISKQYMPIFLVSLSTYLLPHIAGIKNLRERITETNKSLKALLLLATPVLLFIASFSELLIRVLYSPEFVNSAQLLSILVLSDFLGLANKVASIFLIAQKKMKLIFAIDTTIGLLMYLFVYFTFDDFGLISTVYASVVASISYFIMVLIMLKVSCNFTLDIRNYVFIFWIAANILMMATLFSQYPYWFKISYLISLFVATYAILLDKNERRELRRFLSHYSDNARK